MLYRVYLLRNAIGLRYIGISEDVLRRLNDHNAGKSGWTKSRGPWQLVWQSRALSLTEARKLENLLKRQKGGQGLESLLALWGEDSSGS
ncbi:MAG: GIY-YIG nuclease family protein [Verrucomicrobia bacterium]|nr:GIY-YIG nuclease family protein [Verrucomicrobiota bacterium]